MILFQPCCVSPAAWYDSRKGHWVFLDDSPVQYSGGCFPNMGEPPSHLKLISLYVINCYVEAGDVPNAGSIDGHE